MRISGFIQHPKFYPKFHPTRILNVGCICVTLNGFSTSERTYQLEELVISHRKYEDNMYLFEPSRLFLLNRQQMLFYGNEFYQNNQAQICTEAFQYPEKVAFEETLILPN